MFGLWISKFCFFKIRYIRCDTNVPLLTQKYKNPNIFKDTARAVFEMKFVKKWAN